MQIRRLGNSDLQLSCIGLGTWAIGGGDWSFAWGQQDDGDSIATIHRALDLGINWIDTAPVYGLGHAEEVIGRAIKGMQHPPVIATKCGKLWDESRVISNSLKKASVKAEAEASLQRLGLEVIDLYQIHWPLPDEDIEEAWEAIEELIGEGKIRYGGVSNFNSAQLGRVHSRYPVTSLQPPYSMIVPGVEDQLLGYCARRNIGVICYSPMYKGLLSGKFSSERANELPEDDHRGRDRHFQPPELAANLELVDHLQSLAKARGYSVAQLVIAWTLRRREITAAIVGGRQPEQVEQIIPAGSWTLSPELLNQIETLLSQRQAALQED